LRAGAVSRNLAFLLREINWLRERSIARPIGRAWIETPIREQARSYGKLGPTGSSLAPGIARSLAGGWIETNNTP